ncbi:MAG TPA: SGNH/GDSL hydrolase family protein [Thermoanaerobaculia bacterium]|jgi:lysophospholipase L1-like esterase|nr:SGNH/GDSL hydrolase family protein [Thermoanaerobaculia bacterium]
MPQFQRYVAIGDSTVEGLDDPDGRGRHRGWADRLAGKLAAEQGSVLYANLAIRGRTTRQIRLEQLDAAVAMRPDLVAAVSGTNDLLRPRFDPVALRDDIEAMQYALTGAGAAVITFTLPDLGDLMPLARMVRGRLLRMNEIIRDAGARTGTIVCDFAAYPVASDPRLWSDDRLHANTAGHVRIADALAHYLGLAGANGAWSEPLPAAPPPRWSERLRAESAWTRGHLLPWLWRHLQGRSSGDGITAKLPRLTLIER